MSFKTFKLEELPADDAEKTQLRDWVNTLSGEQWKEIANVIKSGSPKADSIEQGGAVGGANNGNNSISSSKIPPLPVFSGTFTKPNDVTYTQWRYAVVCLQKQNLYSDAILLQSIRQSVRYRGFDALYTLGENPTTAQVIEKFDRLFGKALTASEIMQDLYSAKQLQEESIITWSCRLEGLAIDAVNKSAMLENQKNNVLCTQFWSGLYNQQIKNAIRHKYDNKATYEDLLSAARAVEKECKSTATAAAVQVEAQKQEDKLDIIIKRLEMLEARGSVHSNAATAQSTGSQRKRFRGKCFICHKYGHTQNECWYNKKKGNDQRPATGGK